MGLFSRRGTGKRRDLVSCAAGIDPGMGQEARRAIERGRYRIYGAEADGRAVLLVVDTPSLVATVTRQPRSDGPGQQIQIQALEAIHGVGSALHERLDPLWGTPANAVGMPRTSAVAVAAPVELGALVN